MHRISKSTKTHFLMRYTKQSLIVQFKVIPVHRLRYLFDTLNIKKQIYISLKLLSVTV